MNKNWFDNDLQENRELIRYIEKRKPNRKSDFADRGRNLSEGLEIKIKIVEKLEGFPIAPPAANLYIICYFISIISGFSCKNKKIIY